MKKEGWTEGGRDEEERRRKEEIYDGRKVRRGRKDNYGSWKKQRRKQVKGALCR